MNSTVGAASARAILGLIWLCIATTALAQVTATFNLPRQPLADSLRAVASQTNSNILFDKNTVQGLSAKPLKAELSVEQAVARLLAGTGLIYRKADDKTVVILRASEAALPPQTALPPASSPGSSSGRVADSTPQSGQVSDRAGILPDPRSGAPVEEDTATLQEILVTARRREESINTVPVAITALSSEDLRTKAIQTAADLQNYVPSLNVSSSVTRDDYSFSLRGMGPTGGSGPGAVLAGGGTGVVAYFAEVPTSAAGPGLFYDLENVQVAAGPQGTLFGKNTTGGVVLFVPKKPENDFTGSIEVGAGDYGLKTTTAVLNAPLVADKLLVRLAAQVFDRDGFTTDRGPHFPGKDYDNRDYWALRLSVLARPVEGLENYTIFSAFHSNDHGDGFVLSAVDPAGGFASQLLPILAQQQAAGVRSTALSDDEVDKRFNFGVINTTRWAITDAVQFKNIFSYQVQKWLNAEDVDGTSLILDDLVAPRGETWHTQVGTFTEEPQVQGTALNGQLSFTAGAYYEDGHNTGPQPYEVDVAEGNFIIQQTAQTDSERSRGLYGQTSYDFGGVASTLAGLKLTTGYRYTWDNYSYGIGSYSPSEANACLTSAGTYPQSDCFFAAAGQSKGDSWTLGLDYQMQHTLVYVRSGRGYVPGGFNPSFGFTPGGVATPQFRFAPETVVDVELGIKSDFKIGAAPAQISADIFHSNFTNIQRQVSEVLPGGVESNFTANASAAQIEGFEFQGSVVPVKGLSLTATYSYNDGRYTRIDPAAAPSLVGLPFAYLPKHKGSLGGTYQLPARESWGELSVGAFFSSQSRFFDAPAIQPLDYISGYGLLNVRADWKNLLHSAIDLSVYVTNATDKVYRVGQYSGYVANGYITSFYGEPRMFGAQLRYHFGK